ncbi:MAG: aldo/keto reductase [Actinomycetota bacterium]|nr:aldo/keto reductase [Actinomycetota bacterium]
MRYVNGLDTTRPYSVIGLGTWQFGSLEWGYGRDYAAGESAAIVRRARELGITVFDTAEAYGFGRSERILGDALASSGGTDDVVVATKIFPILPVAPIVQQRGIASAHRLGLRTIDLYQVHQPNPLIKDPTTMRGMRALHDVGLVDEVGVSNYSLRRWQAAERAYGARVLSDQVQFNLVHQDPAEDLIPWAQETGHVVLAWSPLAQGLLTGRYDASHRPSNPLRQTAVWLPENLDAAQPMLDVLREVARTHDVTPAQVALAWVVHHDNVVAIPGASSVAQVESNAAAAEIRLTDDEHAALTAAAGSYRPRTGVPALPSLVRDKLPI